MSDVTNELRGMAEGAWERLPYLIAAIVVFGAIYLAGIAVRRSIGAVVASRRRSRNVGLVLGRLAQWVTVFIGLLVGLVIVLPTFEPDQLVQLLGIGSVAIGFAFRDILQNFLAGILLLLTEPFRLEDQIRVGEFEGTVEAIETRATTIVTYDGRKIVLPNAWLFTEPVTVNTAFESRRQEYDIGIGYGDDVEVARAAMLRAMRSLEEVLDDPPPDALVYDLAPSSVVLRARWWIRPPRRRDALESRDQVLTAIKQALTEAGVDMPFDTQVILFHDQTDEADGDRAHQREGWPAGQKTPRSRTIAGSIWQAGADLTGANGQATDDPGRRTTDGG